MSRRNNVKMTKKKKKIGEEQVKYNLKKKFSSRNSGRFIKLCNTFQKATFTLIRMKYEP